jgi:uroporphyrinogen decarboxylase
MPKKIAPIRKPWKGTMTARERFNKQMDFKPVDRCFNMEFGYWEENFSQWNIFTENGVTCNAEADEFLSFDPIEVVTSNTWMDPPFKERVIERRGNINIIQDADGLTAEVAADSHSSIPHYTRSPVETPEDWRRVKEERFRTDSPGRVMDVDRVIKEHPPARDYPLGIGCGSMIGKIRDLLTFEGICYAWADYPEMLEDMVETCCVLVEGMLDQLLGKVDFDYAAGWEDICFNHGPILPPSFFTEVVGPRYKRINQKLKKHGIDLWYTDCDGDVRPILPIFLENGINCLFPFEVNSCTHPGRLLDQYEGLRIMGGVDKMKLLEGKDAIKAYLKSLEPYVHRGGYIPFCDHRCPPDVTPENYLYYLDLKERMFGIQEGDSH